MNDSSFISISWAMISVLLEGCPSGLDYVLFPCMVAGLAFPSVSKFGGTST